MGQGKKIICCCESSCWCCTIEIIYWIVGVLFLISGVGSYFFCKDKVVFEKGFEDEFCSRIYTEHRYVRRIVEGVYYVCMGLLLYCGVKQKSSVLLCIFIVIKMVYFVLSIVTTILQIINSSHGVSDDILTLLLAISLNGFVPYVVWVHKKEIC